MPTSSTVNALRMPPALSKAQGKLRRPAPRADFSMMKMAPSDPSRGPAVTSSGGLAEAEASRLMLSLANSSMLGPAVHTDARACWHATYVHRATRAAAQLGTTSRARHSAVFCGPGRSLSKVSRVEGGGRGGVVWWRAAVCCRCLQVLLGNCTEPFREDHRELFLNSIFDENKNSAKGRWGEMCHTSKASMTLVWLKMLQPYYNLKTTLRVIAKLTTSYVQQDINAT